MRQGRWAAAGRADAEADAAAFRIDERDVPWPGTLLVLGGDLDVSCVRELRTALDAVVAERPGGLVVDLSDVTFIDSLSIAAMVAARRRLGAERRMAVVARHPYVLLIFEAGGLDSVVPLFDTVEQAQAFVCG